MAPDSSQSLFKKPSLFRRFSRQDKKLHGAVTCTPSSDMNFRPQTAPSRNMEFRPQAAPRRDSAIQSRTPSPTAAKEDQFRNITSKPLKSEIITHIRRIDIPSSTSSPVSTHKSSFRRAKVPSNALPTCPFPPSRAIKTTPWTMFLPPSQISALYNGYLPSAPTDKWYIFSEGPDPSGKLKVHFHQRWTGVKVAELFVIMDLKGEGAGKMLGIKWNGSAEMNRMGEEEARFLVRDGCRGALGIGLEGGR